MTRIEQIVVRTVVRALRAVGFDAVRSSYYSPMPDVEALPAGFWEQPSALAGVRFDVDEQLDFARRELAARGGQRPLAPWLLTRTGSTRPSRPRPSWAWAVGSASNGFSTSEARSRHLAEIRKDVQSVYGVFDGARQGANSIALSLHSLAEAGRKAEANGAGSFDYRQTVHAYDRQTGDVVGLRCSTSQRAALVPACCC